MHKNLNNNRGTQVQVVLMKLRGIVKSTGQVIETHEVHKHDHAPYNDKTVLVMHIHPHFCGFTLDVLYHACFFFGRERTLLFRKQILASHFVNCKVYFIYCEKIFKDFQNFLI